MTGCMFIGVDIDSTGCLWIGRSNWPKSTPRTVRIGSIAVSLGRPAESIIYDVYSIHLSRILDLGKIAAMDDYDDGCQHGHGFGLGGMEAHTLQPQRIGYFVSSYKIGRTTTR